MTTLNHATSTADTDPVSATLACLEDLLTRVQVLSEELAATRTRIADLAEERGLREAVAMLETASDGKNEHERQARLRLRLAADADYRHLVEAERGARRDLAELTARLWALRMRAHACLALLRLAGDTGDAADGADAALPATPDTLPEEDPS